MTSTVLSIITILATLFALMVAALLIVLAMTGRRR